MSSKLVFTPADEAFHAACHQFLSQWSKLSAAKTGSAPRTIFDAERGVRPLEEWWPLIRDFGLVNQEAILTALHYLHRLTSGSGAVALTHRNVLTLFGICLALAEKFHSDVPFDNATFAKLVYMPLGNFNALELVVVKSLDFALHVGEAQLAEVRQRVQSGLLGELAATQESASLLAAVQAAPPPAA
eukprot:TRINITY_DN50_c0_g1_i3.p1 TRINITY_DN50_c0_g1~~TRINITY_DN50_c0_g1_i3.p1  ORF type:complete len:187 (-),score=57.94 TRINITY_DN50_c0_g1_i3:214-774(-)